jgi:hypothetical protein
MSDSKEQKIDLTECLDSHDENKQEIDSTCTRKRQQIDDCDDRPCKRIKQDHPIKERYVSLLIINEDGQMYGFTLLNQL